MNKHILVVDDDCNIRSMLKDFLEDETYEVDTASNGLLAWEKLSFRPESYEAVLLDLNMPYLDGLQLIQMLRRRGDKFLSSIIAFSADPNMLQQAVDKGIHRVLAKPFDLEAVLTLVSERSSCHFVETVR
jgi:CheY-like chemotaxis protein